MHQLAVVDSSNKVSIRTVNVGDTVGNQWIVSGNIKPGERVIVEGLQKVRQGMLVDPKPARTDVTSVTSECNQPCQNSSSTARSWRW